MSTSLCHRKPSGSYQFLLDTILEEHATHPGDFVSSDASCVRPHITASLVEGPGVLSGAAPHGLATADFNRDGIRDLIATNLYDNTVSVMRGLGAGQFAPRTTYGVPFPKHLEVADLDGDGLTDVVVSGPGNAVYTLRGNGDGTLQAARELFIGGSIESMTLADIDRNGRPDLIVTNQSNMNNVMVALGNGDGTFGAPRVYAVGQTPVKVIAADVDGDRKLDIITANYSDDTFSVLMNKGNGVLAPAITSWAGPTPSSIAAGDLDLDGKLDLVIANRSGTVARFSGNGNGTFGFQSFTWVGPSTGAVAIADISGDGAPDVIVTDDFSHNVALLHGYGTGQLDAPILLHLPSELREFTIADFDGDAKPDIAVAVFAGNYVALLRSGLRAYPLSITLAGAGTGRILGGPRLGQLCPGTCGGTFREGDVVTLSPFADAGSQFVGWSGACSGTGVCRVTMNAAKSVTATFEPAVTFALTTHIVRVNDGWGNIYLGPAYGATSDGSTLFTAGTVLTLAPLVSPGSTFLGWSGACSGTGTCTVTMDAAKDVSAIFDGAPQINFMVTFGIEGGGSIFGGPMTGTLCPGACSKTYPLSSAATFVAMPDAGFVFSHWLGLCAGQGATCSVIVGQNTSTTAVFVAQ
ncbi:MAG TPA: FG-GAP-like repeat-containing protein [Kofleriaceae bacterium]|nr:FG-GAP-like repeat-containing protein [Kofleriaceae bacterium]